MLVIWSVRYWYNDPTSLPDLIESLTHYFMYCLFCVSSALWSNKSIILWFSTWIKLSIGFVSIYLSGLNYNPTSILFVNVPCISKLQWHPFTVTSNCNMEPDKLSIVIKSGGNWSQKLYQELSSQVDRLLVSVEGPYGPTSSNFLRLVHITIWITVLHLVSEYLYECGNLYNSFPLHWPTYLTKFYCRRESLVMISGGSGITPFISIIREHIFQSKQPNNKIPKMLLICAFKNSADLTMLDLLLPISNPTTNNITQLQLQIEAYITREQTHPLEQTQPLQTIWFKPSPFDSPISSPLGPNSWLWLGTIISSSFIMFLILLALITRYHIYRVDQKSEMIYNFTLKTLWDMFFVCVCVFVTTSVVFMWRKRGNNGMEGKQIQNLEVETPTTSPGWWLGDGGDREIDESLPKHCLTQAAKFHFGARPDLKSKFFLFFLVYKK